MGKYSYRTQGTCAAQINLDVENGIINEVEFFGGCNGNLQGISRLVEGKDIDEVDTLLRGVRCKGNTSCPDQLSRAITEYKMKKAAENAGE